MLKGAKGGGFIFHPVVFSPRQTYRGGYTLREKFGYTPHHGFGPWRPGRARERGGASEVNECKRLWVLKKSLRLAG
jgi:hypothetical protein